MLVFSKRLKCILFTLLVSFQIACLIIVLTNLDLFLSFFDSLLSWVDSNPFLSLFLFVLIDILMISFFLPVPLFNFVLNYFSIYLYSLFPGFLLAIFLTFLSSSIGCALSFLLCRSLIKEQVGSYIDNNHPKLKAVLKAVEHQGVKIIMLMRLAPLPLSLVNYALAITNVRVKELVIGTLGSLPKMIVGAYVAASVESLRKSASGGENLNYWLLAVGLVALIVVFIAISVRAKKELNKIYREDNYKEMNELEISAK